MRVPQLNTLVWRYALEDAGDGAMVWRDAEGQMVAFNMVHRSGTEGWMGRSRCVPIARARGWARPWCGRHRLASRRRARTTIGLETMPRTVDNIGFYSRIGPGARPPHGDPGA